jgi:phosphoribosylformylglycinamidine synthase subunit PurQ / glutaminase
MAKALVIRTAGTNCDVELVRAFQLAGAEAVNLHLDRLIRDPALLDGFDLVGFPGGFSYGDDIASGRIFAMRLRERLYPALRRAILRGVPMIGICNGFQVLVQVGLLPGPAEGETWPEGAAPAQSVALTENRQARFMDRWVGIVPEPGSRCIWTRGLEKFAAHPSEPASESVERTGISAQPDIAPETLLQLPVAHGEGRFVARSPEVIDALEAGGQIALRYTDDCNGSEGRIAGICDRSGLIFGLMPHPERYLDWTRHPYWTRLPPKYRSARAGSSPETPGLRIFRSAVESVTHAAV